MAVEFAAKDGDGSMAKWWILPLKNMKNETWSNIKRNSNIKNWTKNQCGFCRQGIFYVHIYLPLGSSQFTLLVNSFCRRFCPGTKQPGLRTMGGFLGNQHSGYIWIHLQLDGFIKKTSTNVSHWKMAFHGLSVAYHWGPYWDHRSTHRVWPPSASTIRRSCGLKEGDDARAQQRQKSAASIRPGLRPLIVSLMLVFWLIGLLS